MPSASAADPMGQAELVWARPLAIGRREGLPGQPAMVPFTVVDGCGEWKTFVGGGTAAGF